MEGEETFEPSFLGYADEVVEERIADDDVILIKGTKNTSAVCDSTYLSLMNLNSYLCMAYTKSLELWLT